MPRYRPKNCSAQLSPISTLLGASQAALPSPPYCFIYSEAIVSTANTDLLRKAETDAGTLLYRCSSTASSRNGLRYPEGGLKRLCLRIFPSTTPSLDNPARLPGMGMTLPGKPLRRTISISGKGWRCGRPNLYFVNRDAILSTETRSSPQSKGVTNMEVIFHAANERRSCGHDINNFFQLG